MQERKGCGYYGLWVTIGLLVCSGLVYLGITDPQVQAAEKNDLGGSHAYESVPLPTEIIPGVPNIPPQPVGEAELFTNMPSEQSALDDLIKNQGNLPATEVEQLILQFSSSGEKDNIPEAVKIGDIFWKVTQQGTDANWVSGDPWTVTQFKASVRHYNIGLLIHNTAPGAEETFGDLPLGSRVVVYMDGEMINYNIIEEDSYQALQPNSPQSQFIDLADPNRSVLTAGEVFKREYEIWPMTIQTCIKGPGGPNWGRLIYNAVPRP